MTSCHASKPGPDPLHEFRRRVLADARLQARLWSVAARDEFVAACLAMAEELGIVLDAGTVEAAMADNRRAWFKANAK